MKTYLKTLFLATGLLLAFLSHAQTPVSGGLYNNTTWTVANSPYVVTNDVVLFPGFSLTIEPGVEVRFNDGKSLEIRGSLIAVGTATDSITFTTASPAPLPSRWNNIKIRNTLGASVDMRYAVVKYSTGGLEVECCNMGGPLSVKHSSFRYNHVALEDYSGGSVPLYVDRCLFEHNHIAANRADKYITNSTFLYNDIGTDLERSTLIGCEFRGHSQVAIKTRYRVINCLITGNAVGVEAHWGSLNELSDCVITKNDIGLRIRADYAGNITGNTFCGNNVYNIQKVGPPNIDLSGNCFCESFPNGIDSSIFDGYDDVNLGIVTWQPLAASCDTTIYTNTEPEIDGLSLSSYPNPVSERFKVSFEMQSPGKAQLDLVDISGKTALSLFNQELGTGHHLLDFERRGLPAGIYLLRLDKGTKNEYLKLVFL